MNWKTMNSAPQDGTEILIRYPFQGNVHQLASFKTIHNSWVSKGVPISPIEQGCEWASIPSDATQSVASPQHDSDCSTNNRGVPELLGPCDCSAASAAPAEPVAYLRFRAAQQWSGNGNHDIEHSEWLETCHAHEIGDDKLPAFPVYAEPRAIAATSPKCDLTDEQIDTCMATALPNTRPSKGFRNFARAVASLCNGVPETMGDCAKCKGIGAAYKIGKEAASGPNAALVEALKEFISDVTERFDMDSPSTNPGIKSCVEQGRAALAAAGIKEQP